MTITARFIEGFETVYPFSVLDCGFANEARVTEITINETQETILTTSYILYIDGHEVFRTDDIETVKVRGAQAIKEGHTVKVEQIRRYRGKETITVIS